MSTDTLNDEVVGELNPIDLEYLKDYQENSAKQAKGSIPPGAYLLQMPQTIVAEGRRFEARNGQPEKKFVEANLTGIVISGGEFDGREIGKFIRVSTLNRKGQNWSDGVDFLRAFGVDATGSNVFTTVEQWKTAFENAAGQVTQYPVYLTYQGSYKVNGKNVYLKANDFKYNRTTTDGTVVTAYKKFLYLDGERHVTPQAEEEFLTSKGLSIGDEGTRALPKVWANFEPGYRGWAQKQ